MNKTALSMGGLAIGGVLFCAFNLFSNATLRTARLDLTAEKSFTLSDGSKSIVKKLQEPIHLYFYFSASAANGITDLQAYGQRVRELLDEYVLAAGDKIVLKQIDPEPYSEDQDRADAAGIASLPIDQGGTSFYFGMIGTNSTDDKEVIPYFNPENERTLEYDITKLIHNLANPAKKVVGLISSLPIEGSPSSFMSPERGGAWQIVQQLRQLAEVRSLGTSIEDVADDVNVLMIVHPKNLPESTLYAIDQFVLRGGHALVFVDPQCESDQSGQDPSNPLAGMNADKSSNLKRLFDAWGVELVDGKVAADRKHALPVRSGRGGEIQTNLTWLGLDPKSLDKEDPVVLGLDQMILATPGILERKDGAKTDFKTLIHTSEESSRLDRSAVAFYPDFKKLLASFSPEGKELTLAARISGEVSSAFTERPKPQAGEEAPAEPPKSTEHLAQSKTPINVIVVADVDMLEDRFWIQEQRLGNFVLSYQRLSNNGDFAINAIENLTGSNDLISVRARGVFSRPFERVADLKKEAEQLFSAKEQALEQKLRDAERRLDELQKERGDQASLILSPEQEAEIKKFQAEKIETNKDLRAVKHDLNKDIESLGTRLRAINIAVVPVMVCGFALFYLLQRSHRRTR